MTNFIIQFEHSYFLNIIEIRFIYLNIKRRHESPPDLIIAVTTVYFLVDYLRESQEERRIFIYFRHKSRGMNAIFIHTRGEQMCKALCLRAP